jgi:hypothetical protein
MGGSTAAIVPDNIRSAVSRSDPYDPDINPEFAEFAEHYNTVILPARVRKARDKALVENAVQLVYQRIYAPLRNRTFTSLQELNEAIWELLQRHNEQAFSRLPFSRRQLFEEIERSALRPLPTERYPIKTTQMATIRYNYHVELTEDRHYYSVPHYLRVESGKKKPQTKVVYDERVVAIYCLLSASVRRRTFSERFLNAGLISSRAGRQLQIILSFLCNSKASSLADFPPPRLNACRSGSGSQRDLPCKECRCR